MKRLIRIFTLVVVASIFISASHPVYVTVTEIEHNATAHTLEISCKFYVDDLETTLRQISGTKIDLMAPKTDATNDKLINTYVSKHLLLKVNDQNVVLKYIGFELDKEALYAFFEVSQINNLKKISMHQDLLFAQYDEQMGIIHLKAAGKTKSTKLQNPDADASFTLPL